MRKYATEFIGTFFLVFTIVTAVLSGSPLAPLAIGVVLAAMVFAGGHISGAHYNPAVTLAVWIRGKVDSSDVPGYLAAQVSGAISAAAIAQFVVDKDATAAFSLSGSALGKALIAEALVTFALAYVVLNVATSSDHDGNSFYGLAIGFTVMSGVVAVGGISGGVFNPAVAFGVSTAGMVSWSMLWVYLLADLVGGALAGIAFRLLNSAEYHNAPPTATVGGDTRVPAPRAGEPARATQRS
ncbi:MAG TPA: aquaporin [Kineosporiaceae bacterium]|nr:aquaporin [Kineosporiaceae bacterium]